MATEGKQMVCIHCRKQGKLEPVAITEREQEVGVVYCCSGCRAGMEGYSMDIIFYDPDERRAQQRVH